MDGVSATVKNLVFRAAKPEKFSLKISEEFTNAANLIIPLISSIYLPTPEMLVEPPKAPNVPPTPETLQMHQIHKTYKKARSVKVQYNQLIKLPHDEVPHFTIYYSNDKDPLVCSHRAG